MKRTLLLLVTSLMLFCGPQRAMAELQTAVFAGGCFWCLEHDLEHLPGVRDAVSGYSGGHLERPTYRQVSSETTGHQEAVQVRFDPEQISYAELVVTEVAWPDFEVADLHAAFEAFSRRGRRFGGV